jgi:hypothetical protein
VVEKMLLKFALCAPDCGIGCANWVVDDGAAVEKEL